MFWGRGIRSWPSGTACRRGLRSRTCASSRAALVIVCYITQTLAHNGARFLLPLWLSPGMALTQPSDPRESPIHAAWAMFWRNGSEGLWVTSFIKNSELQGEWGLPRLVAPGWQKRIEERSEWRSCRDWNAWIFQVSDVFNQGFLSCCSMVTEYRGCSCRVASSVEGWWRKSQVDLLIWSVRLERIILDKWYTN